MSEFITNLFFSSIGYTLVMLFSMRSSLIARMRLLDAHVLIPQSNSTPMVPVRLKSKCLTLYILMISDWDMRKNLVRFSASSIPL